jgi:Xaa-Pro aminopeptidase
LETANPGKLAHDVEAAWRATIARHGLKKESRIGYSIGIAYPPDWGEHTISLRQGDRTVLAPGHVLHAILGMWMEGWGIEISETLLITRTGCEPLADLPREIFVKS